MRNMEYFTNLRNTQIPRNYLTIVYSAYAKDHLRVKRALSYKSIGIRKCMSFTSEKYFCAHTLKVPCT
jgi:hypothetical protein